MDGLCVFNIQRYCIHDGDGIRTTVFFKGCPLRCAWCHNPESWKSTSELLWNEEKCVQCGACEAACAHGAAHKGSSRLNRALCVACGACVFACAAGARQLSGALYSPEQLVNIVKRDRMFYEESGGGVTLSGGEAMAAEPFSQIVRLCRMLKDAGISVFMDTCGMVSYERFEAVAGDVDCFLYDIKAMDAEKHKKWTGAGNELILDNLWKLSRRGARLRLRLPLVEGVNAQDSDIQPVIDLLRQGLRVEKIHLLPYHTFGMEKYPRLGRRGQVFSAPSAERLGHLADMFSQAGYPCVTIGG